MSDTTSLSIEREIGWSPRPLPTAPNQYGRPVWEPPILDYSDLIDEEYEKKWKAALKYTKGDRARATLIMDLHDESRLLGRYDDWVEDNRNTAQDKESLQFYLGLHEALYDDHFTVMDEGFEKAHATFTRKADGNYLVEDFDDFSRRTGALTEVPPRNAPMDVISAAPRREAYLRAGFALHFPTGMLQAMTDYEASSGVQRPFGLFIGGQYLPPTSHPLSVQNNTNELVVNAHQGEPSQTVPSKPVVLSQPESDEHVIVADAVDLQEASPPGTQRRSRSCWSCFS